jgi:uncharacterized protein (TIGR02246 family)
MGSKNGRSNPSPRNNHSPNKTPKSQGKATTFQQALQRHMTAVEARDLDTFLDTIANDGSLTLILPNGSYLDDYEEIVELHREWFADEQWQMTSELVATHESAEMASALSLVTYTDVDEEGQPIEFQYFLNLLFAKQDNKWVVVHDQNTVTELMDEDEVDDDLGEDDE